MELEEAIEYLKIIKEFAGDNYTFGKEGIRKLKENLQAVLNHITKQEKMIELMEEHISFGEDIQKILCSPKVHKEGACTCITCKRCIKQYFEKKAEDLIE